MLNSKFRILFKNVGSSQYRRWHPATKSDYESAHGKDQYTAHSPLYINKYKTEELRSKIFFEHPPVPNRYAKYFMLFVFMACFGTGVSDKIRRRYKK